MSRLFYHTMQDNVGNLLFDVSGTMRLAGSGTLATIYGDEELTVILPNPMTNHPSFGSFKCFLGAGDYDFYMAKAGYTFETLTGVQGHGTMAQQDASAVAITGGNITELTTLTVSSIGSVGIGIATQPGYQCYIQGSTGMAGNLRVSPGTVGIGIDPQVGYGLWVEGQAGISQFLGVGGILYPGYTQSLRFAKDVRHGLAIYQSGSDVAGQASIAFLNMAGAVTGFIVANATTTTYATTSDARLKHDVSDLTGELATVQALRPVRFRWNADDSPGVGFIASEVAAHVQGVITGEADAMDSEGRIVPQMIDYSKLVPFLTGAVKTLAAQVESLTARLVVLEDALGI